MKAIPDRNDPLTASLLREHYRELERDARADILAEVQRERPLNLRERWRPSDDDPSIEPEFDFPHFLRVLGILVGFGLMVVFLASLFSPF